MINKISNNVYISRLIFRILVCLVIFMTLIIINKFKPNYISNIKNNIFEKSFNFVKINTLSKKIIGKNVLYFENGESLVNSSDDALAQGNFEKFLDGEKIYVSKDLPIGTIQSGVVIYTGNKENYGNTVIIQGTDGFNIWYGNLNNINANLYTYVEKSSYVGSSKDNYIYLLIEKDGRFYSYEEYKS